MDPRVVEALAQVPSHGGTGPFGAAGRQSNLIKAGVSHGSRDAADYLLAKALRAVVVGDYVQPPGYLQRAVQLPFDEHEQVYPSSWGIDAAVRRCGRRHGGVRRGRHGLA